MRDGRHAREVGVFRSLTDYEAEYQPEATSRQCVGGPFCGLRHVVYGDEVIAVLERAGPNGVDYAAIHLRPGQTKRMHTNGGRQIGTYHQKHGRLRWVQRSASR